MSKWQEQYLQTPPCHQREALALKENSKIKLVFWYFLCFNFCFMTGSRKANLFTENGALRSFLSFPPQEKELIFKNKSCFCFAFCCNAFYIVYSRSEGLGGICTFFFSFQALQLDRRSRVPPAAKTVIATIWGGASNHLSLLSNTRSTSGQRQRPQRPKERYDCVLDRKNIKHFIAKVLWCFPKERTMLLPHINTGRCWCLLGV